LHLFVMHVEVYFVHAERFRRLWLLNNHVNTMLLSEILFCPESKAQSPSLDHISQRVLNTNTGEKMIFNDTYEPFRYFNIGRNLKYIGAL
jgi:hypothetical protein